MIVIRVELWSARTGRKKPIGLGIIANQGTTAGETRGDYEMYIARRGQWDVAKIMERPLRTASVKDWPKASYSVWRLVLKLLSEAFPEQR